MILKRADIRHQYLATIIVNLLCIANSVTTSWTNVNYVVLQSDASLLPTGALTLSEATLMLSIVFVGGLFGNILFPWIVIKFGRQRSLLYLAIPETITWLLITFAQNVYYLYVAHFLDGFVSGVFSVGISTYIAEISDDKIRGTLYTMYQATFPLGQLIGFVVINYFDYKHQAWIFLSCPIIYFLLFFRIPESPVYLSKTGKQEELKRSLRFYHNIKDFSESNAFLKDKNISMDNADNDAAKGPKLNDFLKPAARKGFLLSFTLIMLCLSTGIYVLSGYTSAIFNETGSNVTIVQSSIVTTSLQLAANFVAILLIRKMGIKLLLTISTIGNGLGLFGLGCYFLYKDQLHGAYNWIPLAILSYTLFIAACGLTQAPFVFIVDLLPLKIRDVSMSFIMSLFWVMIFLMSLVYPVMNAYFNMHGTLFIFAGGSIVCALYILIFLPDTNGKSHASILILMEK